MDSPKIEISNITIQPLYGGEPQKFDKVPDAVAFVEKQPDVSTSGGMALVRIEIWVYYQGGSEMYGKWTTKAHNIEFLKNRENGIL